MMTDQCKHVWVIQVLHAGSRLRPEWYARVVCNQHHGACAAWKTIEQAEAMLNEHASLKLRLRTSEDYIEEYRITYGIQQETIASLTEKVGMLEEEVLDYDTALDNVGIYPKSVRHVDGTVTHERTPYEDGWNACIMQIRERLCDRNWLDSNRRESE